jgi:HK97 family phage prohead protease
MQTLTFPVAAKGNDVEAQAVITTREEDREGDIIEADGIDLAAFKRNPVVLWAHDYSTLPVAKCTALSQTRTSITAAWKWLRNDPFADRVANAWKQGILNAVSIGFRPKESRALPSGKGVRFLTAELLEFSIVPVPANASALRRMFGAYAKAAGLSSQARNLVRQFAPHEAVLEIDDSPAVLELDDAPQTFALSDPVVRQAIGDGITQGLIQLTTDEIDRSVNHLRGRVDYSQR